MFVFRTHRYCVKGMSRSEVGIGPIMSWRGNGIEYHNHVRCSDHSPSSAGGKEREWLRWITNHSVPH
jgi:hypothetical protein